MWCNVTRSTELHQMQNIPGKALKPCCGALCLDHTRWKECRLALCPAGGLPGARRGLEGGWKGLRCCRNAAVSLETCLLPLKCDCPP